MFRIARWPLLLYFTVTIALSRKKEKMLSMTFKRHKWTMSWELLHLWLCHAEHSHNISHTFAHWSLNWTWQERKYTCHLTSTNNQMLGTISIFIIPPYFAPHTTRITFFLFLQWIRSGVCIVDFLWSTLRSSHVSFLFSSFCKSSWESQYWIHQQEKRAHIANQNDEQNYLNHHVR